MSYLTKENCFDVDWFRNVGSRVDFHFRTDQIATLDGALKYAGKLSWGNTTLDYREDARIEAKKNNAKDYRLWNSFAKELREGFDEDLISLWAPFLAKHDLGKEFTDSVLWDLGCIIMLNKYRDYISDLSFFDELSQIYIAGKFPCGFRKRLFNSSGYFLVY